jgi:hypothetical protein
MAFETKREVLDWYERQPRAFTNEMLASIKWSDVSRYPVDRRLIPVLFYMRDVEVLTDMYWAELRRTPTGKDPVIRKFMERWGVEEVFHGEMINRFLCEAGFDSGKEWQDQVGKAVSRSYRLTTYLMTTLTNLVGRQFTATHMTYGAIHEMSAMQGYRRLQKLAAHPVLTQILNAIIREESAHTKFYSSIARLELRRSRSARRLSRFVIDHFWAPVGQGSLARARTHYAIATLFGGEEGREWADKTVTQRIRQLPGFADLTRVTETVDRICARAGRTFQQTSMPAIDLDSAV